MKKFNKNSIITALVVSSIISFAGISTALAAGPAPVNLLSAGNFVILSKTGISTTGTTLIIGDIGVSPAEATYITGFGLTLPVASPFSTSALVFGKVYAPSYAVPTPSYVSTAVSDMQTAYTDAQGRTNPTATELGAGNIGGMTLAPGLYKWGTGVTVPADVTLSGSANDVWIFQIAQNLNVSSAVKVLLSGGAKANNIFWAVAGQTTIGTTAVFNGNILDQTAIVLNTGAKLNGRALAQTAVTLDANNVTISSSSSATPAIPATPAVSTVSPAVPATPAVPASSSYNNGSYSSSVTDAGCLSGNKFSITTGFNCNSANERTTPATSFGEKVRAIAVNIGQGSNNNNVTVLQQFLISQNKGPRAEALAKVGATAYFGSITRAALAEFQAKVGISPALGNFGAITRAYIITHY